MYRNCSCARTALLERRVSVLSDALFVEFNQGRWCLEMAEVDSSAANGYAGIEIHQLVNRIDMVPKSRSRRALLVECDQLTPGYQLGSGFPHWMAVLLGVVSLEHILRLYKFDRVDLNLWSLDLFQGLAGTMLTLSLFRSRFDVPELDASLGFVYEELVRRLDISSQRRVGFAHGDLGIAYSLLASKKQSSKMAAYISEILNQAEADLYSTRNFAVCSGGVSLLVVASLANKTFGERFFPAKRCNELAKFVASTVGIEGDKSPAHLCCGAAGVVETLLCYAEANLDSGIVQASKNLAYTTITYRSVNQINETGLLFGVAGVDYLISRIEKLPLHRYSMLYPTI
jgi:hypothetical protein